MRPASESDSTTSVGGQPPPSSPNGEPGGANSRQRLLEERATALGRTYAAETREALAAEGRRIAGGWPGTMREMRARVNESLGVAAMQQTIRTLTEDERTLFTRTAYASASKEWAVHALKDDVE